MVVGWLQQFNGNWLGPFLTAFLTMLILSMLRRMMHGKRSHEPVEVGSIRVSRALIWGLIILSALLATLGVVIAILEPNDPAALFFGPFLAIMFVAMGLFSFLSFSPYYALAWDSQGVEGAAKQYSIKWQIPRNRMTWDEIVTVETKKNGVVCLSSSAKSKIYYSQFFLNHGLFEVTLKSKRPDLFT